MAWSDAARAAAAEARRRRGSAKDKYRPARAGFNSNGVGKRKYVGDRGTIVHRDAYDHHTVAYFRNGAKRASWFKSVKTEADVKRIISKRALFKSIKRTL